MNPDGSSFVFRVKQMRSLAFILLLPLAMLLTPTASAGGLRILTWDKETSSSRCIGDTSTPVCTVETIIACDRWQDQALCDAVEFIDGMGRTKFYGVPDSWRDVNDVILYQILDMKILSAKNARDFEKLNESLVWKSWRGGDLAVLYWIWGCWRFFWCGPDNVDAVSTNTHGYCPADTCTRNEFPSILILRQKDGMWIYVGEVSEQAFPREFWERTR